MELLEKENTGEMTYIHGFKKIYDSVYAKRRVSEKWESQREYCYYVEWGKASEIFYPVRS